MYPSDQSDFVIAKSLTKSIASSESDEDTLSPDLAPHEVADTLQELVHTALKLRSDVESTPGHMSGWRGIDEEHVEMIIPENLSVFECFVGWNISTGG